MFPATLFDFNGVLVDDEQVHLEAFRDTLRPMNIAVSERDYFEKYLGFDDIGAFEAILHDTDRSATRSEIERLVAAKRPLYMARAAHQLNVFEGAADLVKLCARNGPVGIVSGALTHEIEFGLKKLGVEGLVGKIISAEHTVASKPDPEGYRMGVAWLEEQIGASATRAVVFEDSFDGIEAAKAVGLPTIALAHSYPAAKLRGSSADLVVDRLADVTEQMLVDLYRRLYG